MRKFFRNIPWKQILCFALVGIIGIGAVVGISSAVTNKTKTISSLVFAVGAIDSEGQYVKNDKSIYTKDLIECKGLKIDMDFEASGTYQVFYYDSNKTFIGCTDVFDTSINSTYAKIDEYEFAKYCRVMYTPDAPKDENGYIDEGFKITLFNLLSYANKVNIVVNKEQAGLTSISYKTMKNVAFYNGDLNNVGMQYTGPQEYPGYDIIYFDVDGGDKVILRQNQCESLGYRIVSASGIVVYNGSYAAEKNVEISIPAEGARIYISVNQVPGNYLINIQ